MIVLVDSSVGLRLVLDEPNQLAEWPSVTQAFASALLPVEVGRVIDRARRADGLDDESVAQAHEQVARMLRTFDILPVSAAILQRAAAPLPVALGTLGAIHLVTGFYVARRLSQQLTLATHDPQLACRGRT